MSLGYRCSPGPRGQFEKGYNTVHFFSSSGPGGDTDMAVHEGVVMEARSLCQSRMAISTAI